MPSPTRGDPFSHTDVVTGSSPQRREAPMQISNSRALMRNSLLNAAFARGI